MSVTALPSPMCSAALQYARQGWPVFPCRERDSEPYTNKRGETVTPRAKAPYVGNGVNDATVDEAVIRGWWSRFPQAMIGIAMGRNGLFALDFDPRHDEATGEEFTLERLKAETEAQIGCEIPTSLAAMTQSDGVHVYLRQPSDGGAPIRNRGNLPLHVDVRGHGGYVIAPPSLLYPADGSEPRRYRWLRGRHDQPVSDAPAELVAVLRAPKARADKNAAGGQPASTSSSTRDGRAERAPDAPSRPLDPDSAVDEAVRRYAYAALDGEVRKAAALGDGERNNGISICALTLGHLVGAGALSRATVVSALTDVARAWPDLEKTVASIESGVDRGAEEPRDLSAVIDKARERAERGRMWAERNRDRAAGSPPPAASSDPGGDHGNSSSQQGANGDDLAERRRVARREKRDRHCAFLPRTDLGNKDRFIHRFGRDFRYVEQWGWVAWDGQRWNRDMAEALLGRAVQDTMRAVQREGALIEASGVRDALPLAEGESDGDDRLDFVAKFRAKEPVYFSQLIKEWGRTSEGAGHISCIAKLAQADLSARPEDFDRGKRLVNLTNGTLELLPPADGFAATFRLRAYRRSDLITKICNVAYDEKATCPRYETFINRVQPQAEMRDFLDCWAGYNMLGDTTAQKMALFYGQGANGKSVWVDTHAHILGDYSRVCGIETFIDQGRYRKGSDASPDLAALAGRRMVRASEPEDGSKFSDGLIKAMTGSEPMPVRELMKPPFEMDVTYKVTVSANNKPRIGTDHGIQRRMQLVPWEIIIPDAEQDLGLTDKLKAEGSGILNRMIRGALVFLTSGLPEPEAVKAATREYQEENDLLGQFLNLCVDRKAGATVGSTALYELFKAWQTWAGEIGGTGKPWSIKFFSSQMRKKGFVISKSSTMLWHDILPLKAVHDFVDADGRPITAQASAPDRPSRGPILAPEDDDLPP